MDNKDNKRGFSGLSDLASEVSGIDEPGNIEPKAEAKTSATKQPASAQRETLPSKAKRKVTAVPPPIETMSSRKSGGGSGWKWILGIFGVIVVILIANNQEQNAKKSSPNTSSPTQNTYEDGSIRNSLAREIENGKLRAKQMEVQIKDMDDRLKNYERRMGILRRSGRIDEYNRLVPSFNALVGRRNDLYEEYSELIEEVNSKVRRYNAEYR